ncbi:uncharacterized protein MONOS_13568 [Monocercomonoides exilis]|uniref:uncharacterized protein n=1 Tax=Monocercomonoides exilis TaxID=2049356 RepID=UPI00355A13E7|nr:hypothetical protein MONOS_13568 [Monocercomonoides exilis]|eukprot:MONOS_13568.1-p1 / transcript=MONOS_13568.1 / gene=MONOS_13568 / organism=Monocercomonoides_exilis_PA203 / gene_product=unspecified product / transcript_product=unspecified product / location=Mono_scaffold00846:14696-15300(-) / protein_length=174 / sequence_SO=supercontig / SO=protein_coding / is_pseudo=false
MLVSELRAENRWCGVVVRPFVGGRAGSVWGAGTAADTDSWGSRRGVADAAAVEVPRGDLKGIGAFARDDGAEEDECGGRVQGVSDAAGGREGAGAEGRGSEDAGDMAGAEPKDGREEREEKSDRDERVDACEAEERRSEKKVEEGEEKEGDEDNENCNKMEDEREERNFVQRR